MFLTYPAPIPTHPQSSLVTLLMKLFLIVIWEHINPEKPDVPLNKNDAFQKVQKRHVQEKR